VKWLSSAPANLMVMGEHSVVAGYNAIAVAINQRLFIEWQTRDDDLIIIESELANHQTNLVEMSNHPKLQWVMQTLSYFKAELTTGLNITIKSEFKPTLGLGSSAAVLAAMLGGIQFYLKSNPSLTDNFKIGLSIIHAIQKRGSGTDLAVSLAGGMILFNPKPLQIKPIKNTPKLSLSLIYCGYKTPTTEVLEQVKQQWKNQPNLLNSIYKLMGEITDLAFSALENHNLTEFYQLVNTYQGLMDTLGVNDATLSQIIYQTRAMPDILASKISGSGLGDCVLTFGQLSTNHNFTSAFSVQLETKGMTCTLIE